MLVGGVALLRHSVSENRRLQRNQEALTSEIEYYTTKSGEDIATIQALELRVAEYRRMHTLDAERIRELDIALRRIESTATTASSTSLSIEAPLRDTTVVRNDLCSTVVSRVVQQPLLEEVKSFRWSDSWVTIEGLLHKGGVECRVESVDTLRQIVHRVPRKFLCFRFGTKAIRQEIVSSNPHTKIVYAEYIELSRRRARR